MPSASLSQAEKARLARKRALEIQRMLDNKRSQVEIAEHYGISRQRVNQLIKYFGLRVNNGRS